MGVIYTSKAMDEEHIEEFKRRHGIPDNVRVVNIDDASAEDRAEVMRQIRGAIREGKFKISPQAKEKMAEDGVSEDDILSALMKEIGLDS